MRIFRNSIDEWNGIPRLCQWYRYSDTRRTRIIFTAKTKENDLKNICKRLSNANARYAAVLFLKDVYTIRFFIWERATAAGIYVVHGEPKTGLTYFKYFFHPS